MLIQASFLLALKSLHKALVCELLKNQTLKNSTDFWKISSLAEAQEFLNAFLGNRILFCEFAKKIQFYLQDLTRNFETLGIYSVPWGHLFYPQEFYLLESPPAVVFMQGSMSWLLEPKIAVVGSRLMSEVTGQWMNTELRNFLQQKPMVTVSGGAQGVDQECHTLSVRLSLPTVVVLPSGLQQLYPKNLYHLKNAIIQSGGCLLSEFLPEQNMQKYFFYHRNRLIAALGHILLVPQCQKRSGSYLSVQHALDLGRSILTVPGHPTDFIYDGNLALLSEGATLVRNAQDLNLFVSTEIQSI